ncbi:MAG: T9SS type A sorting domain-containing protein [Bacteroidota bacterium]
MKDLNLIYMLRYLFLSSLLLLSIGSFAQSTLFIEDFEDSTYAFTLNTQGGALNGSGPAGYNGWVVNDQYAGGSETLIECLLNLPLPYGVPATAPQPMNIMGAPASQYMHIVSDTALADGIPNANFLAADGFCYQAERNVTEMDMGINTNGFDSVEVSFYWICGIGTGTTGLSTFGEVYYSIDGGFIWNLLAGGSTFSNQPTWTQSIFSLPVFAGQGDLRFAFRFVNGLVTSASDPGFGIDQLEVTGFSQVSLVVDSMADERFCSSSGGTTNISYTATGNYGGSNVFAAELSDENGDFSNPTIIGNIPGGINFPVTIPAGLTPGTGYQIRVRSSTPPLIDTLSSLITLDPPVIQPQIVFNPSVACLGAPVTVRTQTNIYDIQWEIVTATDTTSTIGDSTTITSVETVTRVRTITSSGLCPVDTSKFVNVPVDPIKSAFTYTATTPSDYLFFDGSTNASIWNWDFGGLATSGSSNPTVDFPVNQMYTICLEVTSPAGCKDTSCQDISTIDLSSVDIPAWGSNIQLGPIPSYEMLHVYGPADQLFERVEIHDLSGKIWRTYQSIRLPQQFSVSALPQGFYFLKLTADGESMNFKWLHLK